MRTVAAWSISLFFLFTVFFLSACSHTTTTNGKGDTPDTSIAWTTENGPTPIQDDTADWQPRATSMAVFGIAFYPFFPNPARGAGSFEFEITERTFVRIMLDQKVVLDDLREAGNHTLRVDLSGLHTGMHTLTAYIKDNNGNFIQRTRGDIRVE
jgi:hypothetical protein